MLQSETDAVAGQRFIKKALPNNTRKNEAENYKQGQADSQTRGTQANPKSKNLLSQVNID